MSLTKSLTWRVSSPKSSLVFLRALSSPVLFTTQHCCLSESTRLSLCNVGCFHSNVVGNQHVSRLLLRASGVESSDPSTAAVIDQWHEEISAAKSGDKKSLTPLLDKVNEHLSLRAFLHGYSVSSADVHLWSVLRNSDYWAKQKAGILRKKSGYVHVLRWFLGIEQSPLFTAVQSTFEKSSSKSQSESKSQESGKGKKGGKKADQKQSKQKQQPSSEVSASDLGESSASWDLGIDREKYEGKVVTRFPPEPSGYLHIGHVKAVFINFELARRYGGKFIVRLDDTNPTKEREEFTENILRDLKSLGVMPDSFSHTSDYFDYFIATMTRCLNEGYAYVDKSPQEEIKRQRMNLEDSPFRDGNSVAENLRLWKEMQEGTPEGIQCCVRMKLDPKSTNGTLRDPTMYRCNVDTPHPRHGLKYKVYPTYDFACPIVDSVEGVTHACRSKEYNERDEQYAWIWKITCKGQPNPGDVSVPLEQPSIYQFSRLDFTRTVLSKRKLSKMIEQGSVEGWNDPRMPTIQGVLRRGLQLEALKAFVMDQALSRRNNLQEWDKFWTYNKRVLDPQVSRFYCVSNQGKVLLNVTNVDSSNLFCKRVQLHPKDASKGFKTMPLTSQIWLDLYEAEQLAEQFKKGQKRFVLMSMGVVTLTGLTFDESKQDYYPLVSMEGTFDKEDSNFKKIPKVSWVNANQDSVPVQLVELDYLFDSNGEPSQSKTWVETEAFAESGVSLLRKGEVIQFMKRGFFIVDRPFLGRADKPAVMIFIPDGKSKAMSQLSAATAKVAISTR